MRLQIQTKDSKSESVSRKPKLYDISTYQRLKSMYSIERLKPKIYLNRNLFYKFLYMDYKLKYLKYNGLIYKINIL